MTKKKNKSLNFYLEIALKKNQDINILRNIMSSYIIQDDISKIFLSYIEEDQGKALHTMPGKSHSSDISHEDFLSLLDRFSPKTKLEKQVTYILRCQSLIFSNKIKEVEQALKRPPALEYDLLIYQISLQVCLDIIKKREKSDTIKQLFEKIKVFEDNCSVFYPNILYNLAKCYGKQGNMELAIIYYKKSIDSYESLCIKDENYLKILCKIAFAYDQQKEIFLPISYYESSIRVFKTLGVFNKTYLKVVNNLLCLYQKQKETLEKNIQKSPQLSKRISNLNKKIYRK